MYKRFWPGFEPGSSDYASDILGQLNYLTQCTLTDGETLHSTPAGLPSLPSLQDQNCSGDRVAVFLFHIYSASCNYSDAELHPRQEGEGTLTLDKLRSTGG